MSWNPAGVDRPKPPKLKQCEAFITDIRKIRDEYQECMNAAYSRCEYRLGDAYSDIADDLNTALAEVGENTRDPDE